MSFLPPNIAPKGRFARGICALAAGTSSVLLWPESHAAGVLLGALAVFLAVEAARGWCALRACGVKTKL